MSEYGKIATEFDERSVNMEERYVILYNNEEGIAHARKFHYELFRDEEAVLFTECYDIPTGGHNVLHFHNCIEILYAETDTFRVIIGGEEYALHAGDFAAVSSFTIHDCISDMPARRWVILIPPSLLGGAAKQLEGKTFRNCVAHDDGTLLALLKLLYSVHKRQGIYTGSAAADTAELAQIERSLSAAVVMTAAAVCGLCEQGESSVILIELLKYLHLHFREPIHIPELARILLCSQKTLSDRFHRVFHMTINAYINHLRALDVMTVLKENPTMRLAEAAELCGFGSVRNLLRAYKKEFGCTPRQGSAAGPLSENRHCQTAHP